MNTKAESILHFYNMQMAEPEHTYFSEAGRGELSGGGKSSWGMMYGLYCRSPDSFSRFHRLIVDEIWSFYEGDPFRLYLLYPDGSAEEVVMGTDYRAGQVYQFRIPAGVWQGACLTDTGSYALYGCTTVPAFTQACFEIGRKQDLLASYPQQADWIQKLGL
ncbi:MAG: cupin domain-containing protein [Treponema sp.]|nr:cupin domain-containing protein [Treponema sp.]